MSTQKHPEGKHVTLQVRHPVDLGRESHIDLKIGQPHESLQHESTNITQTNKQTNITGSHMD